MKNKIKIIDYFLIGLSLLIIIGIGVYFANILAPNGEYGTKHFDPFYKYNTNLGIILIMSIRVIMYLTILIIGIIWIKRKVLTNKSLYTIFAILIVISILKWIEYWYGSTFYYGEVRDKQMLGFPYMTYLYLVYVIWRYKLDNFRNKKILIVRSLLTVFVFVIMLVFYWIVKEPWILGWN
ncbi:MAG: hypothetical protein KQH79_11495 [Bacteroidetes bacterium]|nr:hypothetical protein [Bacteroidota bacterium]